MGAGLGFFALLTVAAKLNNKAEEKPFVRPLCLCLHLLLGKAMHLGTAMLVCRLIRSCLPK